MFKRAFWFTIGVGAGLEASRRVQRHLRDTRRRYRPDDVVKRLGADVRQAVDDGRAAMAARETALQARRPHR